MVIVGEVSECAVIVCEVGECCGHCVSTGRLCELSGGRVCTW